jgi:peptidoglycan hydrolase-like protein with peptidoglycan-binding domain
MQLQTCDPASPTLIKCPFVEAVRALQATLKEIPPPGTFNPGPEDGYYGPLTTAAVKKFQSTHPPLAVDGIVGPQTWDALCIAHVPPGQAAVDIGPATIEPETSVDIGPATIEPEISPTAPQDSTAPPEEGFTDEP